MRSALPDGLPGYKIRRPLSDHVAQDTLAKAGKWCAALKAAAPEAHFILHRAHWATDVINSESGENVIERTTAEAQNAHLDRLYDIVSASMSDRKVTSVQSENCISDGAHRWGYAPFHYIDQYYADIHDQLLDVVVTGIEYGLSRGRA